MSLYDAIEKGDFANVKYIITNETDLKKKAILINGVNTDFAFALFFVIGIFVDYYLCVLLLVV